MNYPVIDCTYCDETDFVICFLPLGKFRILYMCLLCQTCGTIIYSPLSEAIIRYNNNDRNV